MQGASVGVLALAHAQHLALALLPGAGAGGGGVAGGGEGGREVGRLELGRAAGDGGAGRVHAADTSQPLLRGPGQLQL